MTEQTLNAPDRDVVLLERVANVAQDLRREVEKRIVGQHHVVDGLLTALLANGHALLVGVPGLAKTLLVSTVAEALDLDFSRVQFTPDLMPTDITGTEVIEEDRSTGRRVFRFLKGPIFANIVLADEINRTPPKTQAAMLECMQEQQVTVGGVRHPIDSPFFVLATQNPIELEGTYPLPEAQLDRFLFKVEVPGLDADTMATILTSRRRGQPPTVELALQPGELEELFELVDSVFLPEAIANYIGRLVAATHPQRSGADGGSIVDQSVRYGASPRAAIA
ncbi:MAG: AAA family ATPase, partial [Gemmatimonadetes bacterium]|nr:AAA family ATPase [Gemmatimonadota bacterium]